MRNMTEYLFRREKYISFVTYVLIFALNVVIFGLGVSILSNVRTSASIASEQFMDGGVSLYGIYIGVIVLGSFHFAFQLCYGGFFLHGFMESTSCDSEPGDGFIFGYFAVIFISNFIFNLIAEALFFKFVSCFNFTNNAIVIVRSCLVIATQTLALKILIDLLRILKISKENMKTLLVSICLIIFLSIPSIVIIVLNGVLIAHLKPQLNYNIEPTSIGMGFFNSTEINSIQMGTYMKTNFYSQQIIGNLGDVLFSSKRVFSHKEKQCEKGGCSWVNIYLKQYLYEINCTNQSLLFYKDCVDSSNLTMEIRYDDRYFNYLTYNCLINKVNQTCASNCTQLLANYSLILIQDFENKVEAAWHGLSNCNQPNIKLTHNSSINTCSSSAESYTTNAFSLVFSILVLLVF